MHVRFLPVSLGHGYKFSYKVDFTYSYIHFAHAIISIIGWEEKSIVQVDVLVGSSKGKEYAFGQADLMAGLVVIPSYSQRKFANGPLQQFQSFCALASILFSSIVQFE